MDMNSQRLIDGLAGLSFAMGAAMRAVIRTHPDQQALRQELEFQYQQALAHVTASHMSDGSLEALHLFWESLDLPPSGN